MTVTQRENDADEKRGVNKLDNDNLLTLKKSFKLLYDTFHPYPLAKRIEGCPHCENSNIQIHLHTKQLNELTWDDFGVYPYKAMTTIGVIEDFKHFLPRILELHITDSINEHYDFEIFLSKLVYAHWEEWEHSEQSAIVTCIRAWLASLDPNDRENETETSKYEEVIQALESASISIDT